MAIAVLLLTLASLGLPAPAQAASTGIEFSTDGVTFAPIFTGSLFKDITLVVPGDTETSNFWVRNTSTSAGYLRVVVADVQTSGSVLAHAITVRSSTPTQSGSAVPLSKAAPCWVLVEGDLVPAGGAVKVTSTLALGDLNGTTGQNETATLSLRVGISDAAVGGLPPTSCGGTSTVIPGVDPPSKVDPPSTSNPAGGPHGVIAMTGSEIPYPMLMLGAGALGVGLFLLIAAKRRRREDA